MPQRKCFKRKILIKEYNVRSHKKSTYPSLHFTFTLRSYIKAWRLPERTATRSFAYSRLHKCVVVLDGNSNDRWKQNGMKSID